MNIREAVHKHLTSDTGVVALVSDRVYLAAAPQKPRVPLIVFSVDAGVRDHTQDGASGIVLGRFKIDCLATSAKDAGDVADAVNAAHPGLVDLQLFEGAPHTTEWNQDRTRFNSILSQALQQAGPANG